MLLRLIRELFRGRLRTGDLARGDEIRQAFSASDPGQASGLREVVLAAQPDDLDTLNITGVVAHRRGDRTCAVMQATKESSMSDRDRMRMLLGDRPRFDVGVGGIGAAWRQFFMAGAVQALQRHNVTTPRILEIGSWIGFSTLTWVKALQTHFPAGGTIVCVDPWEDYSFRNDVHGSEMTGTYRAMLASGLTYDLFIHNVSYVPKNILVQPLRGRSQDILPLLREGAFDMIFIDGDHAYDAVRRDIEQSMPLLRHGGILCGDDLDLEYEQCDADFAMRNRDAQPAMDPKTGRVFHPGVTIAVKEAFGKAGNFFGFWAVTREESGWAPFSFKDETCFVPDHVDPAQAEAVYKEFRRLGIVK